MDIILVLITTSFIYRTLSFETCSESICFPFWNKIKIVKVDESGSVDLGQDHASGCMCREFSGKYSFCFGRDNCKMFPRNINITTKNFVLKASRILEIKPGDLTRMKHLESLKIEGNYNLRRIMQGSFNNMTKLKNISISYNSNLKTLEKGCFDGLINLQILHLIKNGFLQLSAVTVALNNLPNLLQLKLSENSFFTVKNHDFQVLQHSSVKELDLILCQIESIEFKAFNYLTNLTVLRLGENIFNENVIANVVQEMIKYVPLRELNLYSVGLKRNTSKQLFTAIANSNISRVTLARNQFEIISLDMFPKTIPNLQFLDLREVLALNITDNAFINLPNLKILLLSGNKLTSIPEHALLKQLTYLDLQTNSDDTFATSYFSLYGQKFMGMENLRQLNLNFNSIHALYNSSFMGLKNLEILGLKNATIYNIASGTFSMLSKLLFLNLENNHFVENHRASVEEGIFKGLTELRVLLLGSCGICYINNGKSFLKGLHKLEHLGLEKNKLMALPNFEAVPHLKSIDLSMNSLLPWQEHIFRKNLFLRDVRINNNRLTYLSDAMIQDFIDLSKLDLRGNPFSCDCHFSWNNKKIMSLIKEEKVFCIFTNSVYNLTVNEFVGKKMNCQNWSFLILLFVIFFCLGIIMFIVFKFRWHLRYWLFLTQLRFGGNRGTGQQNYIRGGYDNYVYDAFVSYSSDDRNFVKELIKMLEHHPPFIKLCVYERDFEVGAIISENIFESIANSRKTILVVSNSYAKSHWCRWESQIAEHHRLFLQNDKLQYADDRLILIKFSAVSEVHMTPTLKYLLKTRIHLQWDEDEKRQNIFWEKLRAALAPPIEINENTYL